LLGSRTAVLEQADDDATRILDERVSAASSNIDELASRLEPLAASVESAVTRLADKERELTAVQSHFTESSSRVETIAEDIREALAAFPDPSSSMLDAFAARVEQVETAAREAAETRERRTGELVRRIDVIDERVATVATEVARAKTLWPVALRSLEARLDDVSRARKPETTAMTPDAPTPEPADDSADLLAGLRHSLDAMETVAAEMARASDALSPPDGESENDAATEQETSVAIGGARIVPLRTGEP
jgi:chromosome segregation ATPase